MRVDYEEDDFETENRNQTISQIKISTWKYLTNTSDAFASADNEKDDFPAVAWSDFRLDWCFY